MIEPQVLEWLLNAFDLGASTAENDPLLESAKIETQEFNDLYNADRIDIIRGIKGSGKTALYRLFFFIREYSVTNRSLHCIFGVEATGDPVFRLFQSEFEEYNQVEFENFWNIYFILLIVDYVKSSPAISDALNNDKHITDKILRDLGIKIERYGYSIKDSINGIQQFFRSLKVTGSIAPSPDPTVPFPIPSFTFEKGVMEDVTLKPIYVAGFRDAISQALKLRGLKIWIMLDRLDEVFPHRSNLEKNGLIGLLKAAYNFSCPELRVKIFLRDDIVDFISSEGFTALTHVFDRCSNTMTWPKDQVLLLITKRLSAIAAIQRWYRVIESRLTEPDYREELFNQVFPERIGKTNTLDWIYNNIADGNGVVTPRDIIDFFRFLKNEQLKAFRINQRPQPKLFSQDHFKAALTELSKHKKRIFLYAEFPNLKRAFLKFEGRYSEYEVATLRKMFPEDYEKTIEDLKSIGFLKYNHKTGTFKIPVIWRKGFNIRNRKAKTL